MAQGFRKSNVQYFLKEELAYFISDIPAFFKRVHAFSLIVALLFFEIPVWLHLS